MFHLSCGSTATYVRWQARPEGPLAAPLRAEGCGSRWSARSAARTNDLEAWTEARYVLRSALTCCCRPIVAGAGSGSSTVRTRSTATGLCPRRRISCSQARDRVIATLVRALQTGTSGTCQVRTAPPDRRTMSWRLARSARRSGERSVNRCRSAGRVPRFSKSW